HDRRRAEPGGAPPAGAAGDRRWRGGDLPGPGGGRPRGAEGAVRGAGVGGRAVERDHAGSGQGPRRGAGGADLRHPDGREHRWRGSTSTDFLRAGRVKRWFRLDSSGRPTLHAVTSEFSLGTSATVTIPMGNSVGFSLFVRMIASRTWPARTKSSKAASAS